ncbi:helix-turn-helix domain-containing protein [Amycolatopsis taiwanensis]|uniref:HTH cro/C1-type domain-containing protein n=1 Tax=Amycolatopsis taiwanensis TaxID=342230 RepID=A0A9W6R515_9PSEU|nr:helix-turn-helix domain-containing protein [Amycolatopsis taiwanensis]GLY68758.1 hypothetical protein Atai01_53770 [Amycolatopsis taiwanensis]
MRSINSFAVAVHRFRQARGLSLGDIAAEIGYSPSYLSKMLHGHRRLVADVVSEIDKVLGAGGELKRIAVAQNTTGIAPERPMQLPPTPADFVGRVNHLRRMDEAVVVQGQLGASVTIVIDGGFWVGKTALALQWAARVQNRFPGGCLFADLRGLAPGTPVDPDEVLDAFLRALGAGAEGLSGSIADRAARYRSLLAERPAVVVLDNVANYEQVRHLLPGAGSVAVVTSREHQATLLMRTGGLHIDVPVLTQAEALALLRRRIGDARVGADLAAAETVVRLCGLLPMAVLIAAEHIQHRRYGSLDSLARELAEESSRLRVFASPDTAANVGSAIDVSYLALPPRARRVFRLLGISPAHVVSVESTAALTGLSTVEARDALDVLRDAHLLEDASSGRMTMNHLVRAYARERAGVEEHLSEVDRAHDRMLHWYVATTWATSNALAPDWSGLEPGPAVTADIEPLSFEATEYDAALAWCDAEIDTLVHLVRRARIAIARDALWILPTLLLPYFCVSKKWSIWVTVATESLAAARAIDSPEGIAWSLHSLAWAQHELGRTEEAVANLYEVLRIQTDLGSDRARGWASFSLGVAHLTLGQYADARDCLRTAEGVFSALDFDLGLAFVRATLAQAYQALGEPETASRCAYDALTGAQKVHSLPVIGLAHHQLGLLLLRQHRYRAALTHFDAALTLRRHSRERWAEADTLIARATTFGALNENFRARESYREALAILGPLNDPRSIEVQEKIAVLDIELRGSRILAR